MPNVLPDMPTSTVPSMAQQAGYVIAHNATVIEFVAGIFLAMMVIRILLRVFGYELDEEENVVEYD